MKIFTISSNDANQRLDKFLKKLLPNASLTLIYKLNRKNCVKVDGKRRDNEYRINEGEEIKLFVNDEDYAKIAEQVEKKIYIAGNELKKPDIVYEDKDLLIMNKEPGILVHP
jgi:23S rRNA-/tRNA-specific pseudouridylate synthase